MPASLVIAGGCALSREGLSGGAGGAGSTASVTTSSQTASSTASGATPCKPGTTEACYSGPPRTEGVGVCVAGKRTCAEDGMGFGACAGEVAPSAEICGTPEDESCEGEGACKGDVLWSWGVVDAIENWGRSVAVDPAGNMIVAAGLKGDLDLGGGPLSTEGVDVVLAKYAPDGALLFSQKYGDASFQDATDVAAAPDGSILLVGAFEGMLDLGGGPLVNVAGNFIHDIFVARMDPDGKHVWSKQFGDAADQDAYAVTVDAAGSVIVAGKFAGALDFGGAPMNASGLEDVFVAKLSPDGDRIWSKRFGDASKQEAWDVAVDAAGDVIVVGDYGGDIDFGGPVLHSAQQNGFVAKLGKDGGPVWSLGFGDYSDDRATGVAVDPSRNVYISGYCVGALDLGGGDVPGDAVNDGLVAKLDPDGKLLWARRFGDYDQQQANAIAVDTAGNAVVTGMLSGSMTIDGITLTSHGGGDVFVLKLDPTGKAVWGKSYGDTSANQLGLGVSVDASGNAAVVGQYDGTVAFGAPLVSVGGFDLFIARFSP